MLADKIQQYLKPKGVIVLAKGVHMCMVVRGVEYIYTLQVKKVLEKGILKLESKDKILMLNLANGIKTLPNEYEEDFEVCNHRNSLCR